jgi:hypothetical protein
MHTLGFVIAASGTAPPWAVYAALIAAAGALVGQWFVRRKEALDRRRDEYSKAFAAAMLWLEFPYRIARRLSNGAAEVGPIVLAMHEAQQQIEFHSNWLRSVSEGIAEAYAHLIRAVKEGSREHIEDAWRREPAVLPDGMILGDLYAVDVTEEINAFAREIRRDLSLWHRVSS